MVSAGSPYGLSKLCRPLDALLDCPATDYVLLYVINGPTQIKPNAGQRGVEDCPAVCPERRLYCMAVAGGIVHGKSSCLSWGAPHT